MPSRCVLLVLLWIGAGLLLNGRTAVPGYSFLRNYTSQQYNHQPQNWSIAQDKRGVMFIANQAGLLEYDGTSWRVLDVPNHLVRSIALDNKGRLYSGGKEELGYFELPSQEHPYSCRYTSLTQSLKAQGIECPAIMRVHATSQGIFFRAAEILIGWQPETGRFTTWKPSNRFHTSFVCRDTLYVNQPGTGLMVIKNNSLEAAPGGPFFAAKKIYMMVPFDDSSGRSSDKLLIGTRSHGLYLYDKGTIEAFQTQADDYLLRCKLYHGIRLRRTAGQLALATLDGGLVIIDTNGRLRHIYDTSSGLQDKRIYFTAEDRQGNLWLALNNGITKIEYHSPFSILDRRLGLQGFVLSVAALPDNENEDTRQQVLAGTDRGLFYYEPSNNSIGRFRQIPAISGYCWDLLSVDNHVLAAASRGIFVLNPTARPMAPPQALTNTGAFTLTRSIRSPDRVWCGTANGLLSLVRDAQEQWRVERQYKTIGEKISSIVETPDGQLWLAAGTGGILRLNVRDFPLPEQPDIVRYHTAHGLPGGELNVAWIAGHVMVSSEQGIFRFHAPSGVFVKDTTLGLSDKGQTPVIFRIAQDPKTHVWYHSRSRNYHAIPQADNGFIIDGVPFLRLSLEQVNAIRPGSTGDIIWFARHDGLFAFDAAFKRNDRPPFSAIIREVLSDGVTAFYDESSSSYKPLTASGQPASASAAAVFHKDHLRSLRIRFAAPYFEDEAAVRFSTRLDGYDNTWSPWTAESHKDYTNLDPGLHRFHVKARNVYGVESDEAVYTFRILPPWYRSTWAYLLYALCGLLLLYGGIRWRFARLEKEKTRLEHLVGQRTREVQDKNRQLQEMARVKSRFFANISHEFRTPLTLIMGPLEDMSGKPFDSMLHNSRRLLNLIDQLLELSKIESGKMKLKAAPQDIVPFLKGILASFEMEARRRQVTLKCMAQPPEILVYFDVDILDKIICNLLSNALKFTPGEGRVTLSASIEGGKMNGSLVISVQDTGAGIPEDQLPHIFDRFYQAGNTQSYEGTQKGSGIGLALVKELVTLHHGRIEAFSDGSGSRFTLHLPLGHTHFADGEVIAMPETFPRPRPVQGTLITPEPEPNEEDLPDGNSQEPVILVVEDNAEMRHYIAQSLHPGFTVVQAVDGSDGVKKARDIIPDLIISDVMMPHIDGYQLCATLKKDVKTSHIPIILLTARASDENIIKGLEIGSDDYITKPFNAKILNSRVKNLIDLRRDLHQRIQRDLLLQPSEINVSSVDETFLKELQEMIEKSLSDSAFNVEALAGKLYMSRPTLYRKVMALTGQSPNHFIRSYRLKRAAQLLQAKFGNVTEVAMEVGFTNMAHFAKCFKEAFHQLPSHYQSSESGE